MFIVFEGIDRAGKTLQVQTVATWLKKRFPQQKVWTYKFPSKEIKKDQLPRDLMTAYLNDFIENHTRIISHIYEGDIVLVDRWIDSNIAYSVARGVPEHVVRSAHKGLIIPDMTFIFLMEPEEALQRKPKELDFEENVAFQERVYVNYENIFWDADNHRTAQDYFIVNANMTVEEVFNTITDQILLIKRGHSIKLYK